VTDEELRDLQERAFQLEELQKHPGWLVLQDFAVNGGGGLRAWQTFLLNGNAKTQEQYQNYVGRIFGCERVLDASEVVRAMADDAAAKFALAKFAIEAEQ
jgi:hypothetical protein